MKKREKRKRAYIPYPERLAAALAMLLPADQRDALRAARAPAKAVEKLFHLDHGALHALGGSNKWHNLTPMQVKPHQEKSRGDTKIVAKIDRIIAREQEHKDAMRRVLRPSPKRTWPKRKIQSRGFRRSC
jgi:hypothetical protein